VEHTTAAYFLEGPKILARREIRLPDIPAGWALIKVHRVGICGSDIEYYSHSKCGVFVPRQPFVLGHEFSGEVVRVGKGVQSLPVGSRVTVDPSIPCRSCHYCTSGRYNLCTNMRVIGSASGYPHLNGAFSQYVAVPAENCHKFSEQLSFAEAAFLEPLSVAVYAALRPRLIAGQNILITGAGTIGQLLNLVLRDFGAGRITVSDLQSGRRQVALEGGADYAIDPKAEDIQDNVSRIAAEGFDLIFEASGAAPALDDSLRMIRRGGTIVQIGTLPDEVTLPANKIMTKELTVLGSFRYAHVFSMALNLLEQRRIDVRPLISETFTFEKVPEAFERGAERGDSIKLQVAI
jgi:L-idonate 5-dehydrogenase